MVQRVRVANERGCATASATAALTPLRTATARIHVGGPHALPLVTLTGHGGGGLRGATRDCDSCFV